MSPMDTIGEPFAFSKISEGVAGKYDILGLGETWNNFFGVDMNEVACCADPVVFEPSSGDLGREGAFPL